MEILSKEDLDAPRREVLEKLNRTGELQDIKLFGACRYRAAEAALWSLIRDGKVIAVNLGNIRSRWMYYAIPARFELGRRDCFAAIGTKEALAEAGLSKAKLVTPAEIKARANGSPARSAEEAEQQRKKNEAAAQLAFERRAGVMANLNHDWQKQAASMEAIARDRASNHKDPAHREKVLAEHANQREKQRRQHFKIGFQQHFPGEKMPAELTEDYQLEV